VDQVIKVASGVEFWTYVGKVEYIAGFVGKQEVKVLGEINIGNGKIIFKLFVKKEHGRL